MKFWGIWLALVCAGCLWAAPDSLVVSVPGYSSPTAIWWPAKAKGQSAPVMVWFHGGMTSSNCSKGLTAGHDLADIYPAAIVVSVSACMQNHWWTSQLVATLDAALDSVAARRKSPVGEVHLVGISDGSLGVLSYSLSGKRSVKNRLLMSSYGAAVGEAEQLASSPRMQSGRWRFLQGGSDRLYPAEKTVPWIENFCKSVQVDCRLRFDPSGEHDWSYWKDRHKDWIVESLPIK